MGFDSFVGNTQAVKVLRDILASGRIPGALLFGGPDGVGKKTLAAMFAKALNCEQFQDDFCGRCTRCLKVQVMLDTARSDLALRKDLKEVARRTEGFVYFDVQVIEPLGRFILIEQVRQLRNVAYTHPFELSRRVFIIDQAQAVHWQAVDVLLKVLEESPETTTLVLVCTNRYELRPTIRSRCRLIQFTAVDEPAVMKILADEGRVPEAQQPLVARLTAGSVARAKDFNLDEFQHKRKPWMEFLSGLLDRATRVSGEPDWKLLFESTRALAERREEFQEILRIGYSLLGDLMRILEGQPDSEVTNLDVIERLRNWAPKLRLNGIEALKSGLDEAYRLYARNINLQLCLDALAVDVHILLKEQKAS